MNPQSYDSSQCPAQSPEAGLPKTQLAPYTEGTMPTFQQLLSAAGAAAVAGLVTFTIYRLIGWTDHANLAAGIAGSLAAIFAASNPRSTAGKENEPA